MAASAAAFFFLAASAAAFFFLAASAAAFFLLAASAAAFFFLAASAAALAFRRSALCRTVSSFHTASFCPCPSAPIFLVLRATSLCFLVMIFQSAALCRGARVSILIAPCPSRSACRSRAFCRRRSSLLFWIVPTSHRTSLRRRSNSRRFRTTIRRPFLTCLARESTRRFLRSSRSRIATRGLLHTTQFLQPGSLRDATPHSWQRSRSRRTVHTGLGFFPFFSLRLTTRRLGAQVPGFSRPRFTHFFMLGRHTRWIFFFCCTVATSSIWLPGTWLMATVARAWDTRARLPTRQWVWYVYMRVGSGREHPRTPSWCTALSAVPLALTLVTLTA